ncbi:ADP-ribosylglycohydrolase family protein, partial [Salmonella enterica]|uniref:ADP-ribosylglycohydrolase family protein n=1 Tax=Salmonella enterica TaxID=28901 RepID=UPI00398C47AA
MKAERILGARYGQALGDAMGMPSELWPKTRVKAHFGWSDRLLPGPKANNAACYFTRAEVTDDTAVAPSLDDAHSESEDHCSSGITGR